MPTSGFEPLTPSLLVRCSTNWAKSATPSTQVYLSYTRYPREQIVLLVRVTGIEPARLAALEPKSSASASSATPAFSCLDNYISLL